MGWYDDDYVSCSSARKIGKPMGPCAPHYPNKAERVLLTQMMQKSGKTEAEIREDKSNRIKLSAAQKSMSQGKGKNRRFNLLLKRAKSNAAFYLGVPVWDQKVTAYLEAGDNGYRGSIMTQISRKVYGPRY